MSNLINSEKARAQAALEWDRLPWFSKLFKDRRLWKCMRRDVLVSNAFVNSLEKPSVPKDNVIELRQVKSK